MKPGDKIINTRAKRLTLRINFKTTYKSARIISEVINDSAFILGCLAWDIMQNLISQEVYFY